MGYPTEPGLYWAVAKIAPALPQQVQRPTIRPQSAQSPLTEAITSIPAIAPGAADAPVKVNVVTDEGDVALNGYNAIVEVYATDEVLTPNGVVPSFALSVNLLGNKRALNRQPRRWRPNDIAFGEKIVIPAAG